MHLKSKSKKSRSIHFVSLGCARNRVDSEVMLGALQEKNWVISSDPKTCDVIVINTCGFIQASKEESIETILECVQYKETNPELKVVVAGCLTQRYKSQLATGLPEVDLFIGTDQFPKIGELLEQEVPKGTVLAKRANFLLDHNYPRVNTLARGSAYVKVAEGCQHNCSFCIIPAIRGPLRSRAIKSVVLEVEKLVASGVVEINLIAQDLAAYGRDLSEDQNLLSLLKSLIKIEGLKWIRMLYVYPENISDEFLEFFAREPKLVKYLDMPVQHSSDKLLAKMNRGITSDFLKVIIEKIRSKVPDIALRTSVMVGFPGETDEDFAHLCEFVKAARFTHLGCFTYSKEEGTVAGRMTEQVEEHIKQERQAKIMGIQKAISTENMRLLQDKKVQVLITQAPLSQDEPFVGRLSSQAPEVDGVVYVQSDSASLGQIQELLITDTHEYDVSGCLLR